MPMQVLRRRRGATRGSFGRCAGLVVALLVLAGCGPSAGPAAPAPSATGSEGQPGPGGRLEPLGVVYNNQSIGSLPLWLTLDQGYFAKHGLDVTLQFAQGTLAEQAIIAGQYEVGNVSISAVLASNTHGGDTKLIAAGSTKLIYALVSSKDITSVGQLRGKNLAIARIGDSSDTATRLILRKLGLDPEQDFSMIQVGNSPERYSALVAGNVQGMIADPMDVVRARREGFNVLADPAGLDIDYGGGGLAMTPRFLREQRDTARRYLLALLEGIHHYKIHEDDAVAVAARRLQSDDLDAIRDGVRVFARTLIPAKPYLTEPALRPVLEEVAFRLPAVKDVPLDRFVDHSLLEEIDRSGFIDALYR
jgi:ABC-type nitrate/sulfonate/bicarbonate transport system substrate-binding protein